MKKRFLCLVLCVVYVLALAGWSCDGGAYSNYFDAQWYGWYEITDATGIYESRIGIREDCMADTSVYAAHLGESEGQIAVYDQNHYTSPLFLLDANFDYGDSVISGGTLESQPLTGFDIKLQGKSIIDVDNVLWIEGTLEQEKGSITIRGLLIHAEDAEAWDKLEEDRGNLERSYEELLPMYYASRYAGGEWTPATFFGGLDKPMKDVLHICWAGDYEWKESIDYIRLGQDEPFVQLVLTTDVTVKDLQILQLRQELAGKPADADKEVFYSSSELFLQLPDVGETPMYGIRYYDHHGGEYTYLIQVKDGAVSLVKQGI